MAGHIFLPKYGTFSRMSLIKPSTPCLYNPFKRYNQASKGHHYRKHEYEERAPSVAEEFKRMAEQKLREAEEQGIASQVSDKTHDGAEEATLGEPKVKNVKKRFKEDDPGADYRRTDHDHDDHK